MLNVMSREEAKNKLRESIEEFLRNDESLERIPIDNEKQVLIHVILSFLYI